MHFDKLIYGFWLVSVSSGTGASIDNVLVVVSYS